VSQQLSCGDVVFGTNEGGSTVYNTGYWELVQELGALINESPDVLDGPERVFSIMGQTPGQLITVTVQTCQPMWESWRQKGDVRDDWCAVDQYWDTAGHLGGTELERTYSLFGPSSGTYDYEIIVDSWYSSVGNFMLTVDCY